MPLPKLPVHSLDDINHRRNARERLNSILDHSFDDSRRRTPAEAAAGVTPANYAYEPLNFLRYGADPTGLESSSGAWGQMMLVVAQTSGGSIVIPPGDYLFDSQATFTPNDEYRFCIEAFGATFTTTGALWALVISGGTTNGGVTINGLNWRHVNDASALGGIRITGTSRTRLNDCHARAGTVSSSYIAILVNNLDPADADSGSYWTEINNFTMRRNSGLDGTRPARGIVLRGAANATKIIGGELGDCDVVVAIEPEAANTYISNGVLIMGAAFEGYNVAIHSDAQTTVAQSGMRILGCRFEGTGTPTLLSLTGSTVQPATPTYLCGNYWTPDQVTYVNNPNGLYYFSLDASSDGAVSPHLDVWSPVTIKNRTANLGVLDLQTGLNDAGVVLRDQAGTTVLDIRPQTGIVEIGGNGASSVKLRSLKGIGSSATYALNFGGDDAFSASTTRTVTFATAEPDTSFRVDFTMTADPGGRVWVSAKTVNGFTLTSSASNSATFTWSIHR
jgi:hypothetical protein